MLLEGQGGKADATAGLQWLERVAAQGKQRIALKRESLPEGSDLAAAGLDIARDGEPAFLVTCAVVAADARMANINIQGAGRVEDHYQRALSLVRGIRW